MMQFTVGDTVVYDGAPHLVKKIDGDLLTLMDVHGDYTYTTRDYITGVYWD